MTKAAAGFVARDIEWVIPRTVRLTVREKRAVRRRRSVLKRQAAKLTIAHASMASMQGVGMNDEQQIGLFTDADELRRFHKFMGFTPGPTAREMLAQMLPAEDNQSEKEATSMATVPEKPRTRTFVAIVPNSVSIQGGRQVFAPGEALRTNDLALSEIVERLCKVQPPTEKFSGSYPARFQEVEDGASGAYVVVAAVLS